MTLPSKQQYLYETEQELDLDPVAICGPARTDHDWALYSNVAESRGVNYGHDYEALMKAMDLDVNLFAECTWCGDKIVNPTEERELG